ncbi:MAG: DUF1592 domain-containing protein [Verrucomicrobia bacterium]|nr:DUF1592 domain-containing protein [Verrucomicrobiota bacterium]
MRDSILKLAAIIGVPIVFLGVVQFSLREKQPAFQADVKPVLSKYCYECHGDKKKKGGLSLQAFSDEAAVLKNPKVWETVLHHVRTHEMPPERKPQPTQAQRDLIARWIEAKVFHCDCDHPDPGRVTLRRLNRVEYNNTIRDLVGVDFQPADDFPADDVGYGFDNIGDVLSLPPILLEKYMAVADKILGSAIVINPSTNGPAIKFPAGKLESTAPGSEYGNGARILTREGEVFTPFQFPKDGEYTLRARAFGQQAGPDPARMEFRLDGKAVKVFDVKAVENAPAIYEIRVPIQAGEKKLAAAYINNYVNPDDPNPDNRDRNLIIDYLEVVGPPGPPMLPETHKRIFIRQPTPTTKLACAREIIGNFARRAFRRPVSTNEVERLVKFVELADQQGESFEKGIKLALQAVLVSPHFLFRGELQPEPDNPKSIHLVNEYALASRLSYFLWSTMPDDKIFALAEHGRLRKNLESQVKRMLNDPKSEALVDNFAGQWLQIRNLQMVSPDHGQFPDFDDDLRRAMEKETKSFFSYIMRKDRSVLDFLDANYTFLNERLARHYGIAGVKGDEFQRVTFAGKQRGGVLTHAGILTITSNPTRTSPVKRGKWVLENLLGTPPPPPPGNVPELSEAKEVVLSGTLRQRMEQHRADPNCAGCHARMDPIGFGFENFDAIGKWREKDGNFPIDASGELVTGESFNGVAEFRDLLVKKKKEDFIRCLSEKMLTYALGRGLEHYDKCAIDQISKGLAKNNYKFSALVLEVVKSTPFQKRRGEEQRTAQAGP